MNPCEPELPPLEAGDSISILKNNVDTAEQYAECRDRVQEWIDKYWLYIKEIVEE